MATAEVADSFKGLTIATFGGNPVSCAAALATIEVIEEENLVSNAQVVGSYLRGKLEELKEKYPLVGDVRGMGLMQGVELVREQKEPAVEEILRVFEATRRRGLLIGKGGLYGNVIRIEIPPLTEERRKDLVKLVRKRVEEGRVAIRNVRREALEKIRLAEKEKEISEDEARRLQDKLQKLTDSFIESVDRLGKNKETEILEV